MWKRKQDLVTSACDVKLELAGMQQRECVTGLRVQTGTSITLWDGIPEGENAEEKRRAVPNVAQEADGQEAACLEPEEKAEPMEAWEKE